MAERSEGGKGMRAGMFVNLSLRRLRRHPCPVLQSKTSFDDTKCSRSVPGGSRMDFAKADSEGGLLPVYKGYYDHQLSQYAYDLLRQGQAPALRDAQGVIWHQPHPVCKGRTDTRGRVSLQLKPIFHYLANPATCAVDLLSRASSLSAQPVRAIFRRRRKILPRRG